MIPVSDDEYIRPNKLGVSKFVLIEALCALVNGESMSEYTCELELTVREQEERIAELEQELAGMKHVAGAWKDKFVEHSMNLSRYAGAVEVKGYLDLGGDLHIGRQESLKFKNVHGDVKVLVTAIEPIALKEVELVS